MSLLRRASLLFKDGLKCLAGAGVVRRNLQRFPESPLGRLQVFRLPQGLPKLIARRDVAWLALQRLEIVANGALIVFLFR